MSDTNIYDQMIGNNVSQSDIAAAMKNVHTSGEQKQQAEPVNQTAPSQAQAHVVSQQDRDAQIAEYYKRRSQESSANAGKKSSQVQPVQAEQKLVSQPKAVIQNEEKPAVPVQSQSVQPNEVIHPGRPSAEKEKIFNAATSRSDMPTDFRVRKDELKKKTTVRDVPKPVISYLTALFAGMGFYKASMKDMVAAFIAANVDPDIHEVLIPCLSDMQKAMTEEYMKRHKSMTDEFKDTKKKMDMMDKKLDTIRMMAGWLITDKCGYGPETYPSPTEIVLNHESDRGMVSDVIIRADKQVGDVRTLVGEAEGRPQSGK